MSTLPLPLHIHRILTGYHDSSTYVNESTFLTYFFVDGDFKHISLASVAKVCSRFLPLVINMVIGILIDNMVD